MAFQIFPDSLHFTKILRGRSGTEPTRRWAGKEESESSQGANQKKFSISRGYKGIRDSVYGLWRILCTVMNICGFHDFQELCRYQSNLEVPRVSLWHDREWTIFAFERDPIHSYKNLDRSVTDQYYFRCWWHALKVLPGSRREKTSCGRSSVNCRICNVSGWKKRSRCC